MNTSSNFVCSYMVIFKGKLTVIEFRPNGLPDGASDRDSYSLRQLPQSKDITETTFVGDIVIVEQWSGINSGKVTSQKCIILAKKRQELLPIGEKGKITNLPSKETSLWATLFNAYKNNRPAYVVVQKKRGSIGIYNEIMSNPILNFENALEEADSMSVWTEETTIDFRVEPYNGKGIGETY